MNVTMDLTFLKNLNELNEPESKTTSKISSKPEKGDIKVTQGGQISYSDKFKEEIGEGGLDFINSSDWSAYSSKKDSEQCIFTCITPKDAKYTAKLDVKNTSTPKPTNVEKFLIPMLRDLYKIEGDFLSIELKAAKEFPLTNKSGVYNIPKVVSGGANAGNQTVTRRENTTFWPLLTVEAYEKLLNDSSEEVETATESTTTEKTDEDTVEFTVD